VAKSRDYWIQALADNEIDPFPVLPASLGRPVADTIITRDLICPDVSKLGVTTTILLRASWAIVMGNMASAKDVVFGTIVSGRSASVQGVDETTGPTIAALPIRVKLEDRTIAEYLEMVNDQALNMIPFEQTGLDRIAAFDPALQRACQFQTLLVVQPATDMQSSSLGKWRSGERAYTLDIYSLVVEISINQGALNLRLRSTRESCSHGLSKEC
jgi:hypothetical protein